MVEIRYAITFTPQPGSHPVDIVDIGMPNENYDLGTARAAIAGTPLTDIRDSEYVKPGVEVHLGGSEITARPDQAPWNSPSWSRSMIYPDSDDSRFASLQFKTTWYDGKYVSGNAERIEIQFNLPPGTTPEEVKYHALRPQRLPAERDVFTRTAASSIAGCWLDRPATVPYAVGASFPRNLVAGVYSPPRPPFSRHCSPLFSPFSPLSSPCRRSGSSC